MCCSRSARRSLGCRCRRGPAEPPKHGPEQVAEFADAEKPEQEQVDSQHHGPDDGDCHQGGNAAAPGETVRRVAAQQPQGQGTRDGRTQRGVAHADVGIGNPGTVQVPEEAPQEKCADHDGQDVSARIEEGDGEDDLVERQELDRKGGDHD